MTESGLHFSSILRFYADTIREIALDLLQKQKDKTVVVLEAWLETEKELPHTLSLRYMSDLTEEIFNHAGYLREGEYMSEEEETEEFAKAQRALLKLGKKYRKIVRSSIDFIL